MFNSNITSANAVFRILIPALGISSTLEGFSADAMFSFDAIDVSQNIVGADGQKSSGFIFNLTDQTIDFAASSRSIQVFETLYNAQILSRDIYTITGDISMDSVKRNYVLTNGTLLRYMPQIPARRTLDTFSVTINWGNVIVTPT
jgi:hypothetical protein